MTETRHQQMVFKWSQQPSIRSKWPELRLLYHVGNERKCTPAQGKQLKLSGVRSGVPDLHLPVARGEYHSLYIEMKAETGSTSDEQDYWIDALGKEGNFCEVCHGYESAVRVIERYLSMGRREPSRTS